MNAFTSLTPAPLEMAFVTFEAAYGVSLTVRDLDGSLAAIGVHKRRNSHRRQTVCDVGFNERCLAHCRHTAGPACQQATGALTHTCWKGVREVLAPVRRDGVLIGYVFAGAWRGEATPTGPWKAAWQALPTWDAPRAAGVAAALTLFADGLAQRRPPLPKGRAGVIHAWLRAHLVEPGLRAGLARHLGLSRSRTSHVVREATGRSLEQVVAEERFAAARALLADTTLTVADIGCRVGWADPPHFSRTFRHLAGCSPSQWRLRQRLA